jgi:D-cysteine desulfhydrase
MNLARFPRRRYTNGATPIEYLEHLSNELDGPRIYMKRDDLLGGAAGGNKTRKLEFVVADALAKRADTLITCGAVQSNHCRLTLSAAVREGLKCRLVLEERVANSFNPMASGNNLLFKLMEVDKISVVPGGSDMMAEMEKEAQEVKSAGGTPYIIPGGASNEIGALGYVACAEEMLGQFFDLGLKVDRIVCASGSAGTHAGLVTGLLGNNAGIDLVGVNVSRTKEVQEELVYGLAQKTAKLLGLEQELPRESVVCFGDYVGEGYSIPTEGMVEAVKMLASKEAILMDPVYTGKAMAGMIDLCRKGYFTKDETILFVHTGGAPALYAYLDSFLD